MKCSGCGAEDAKFLIVVGNQTLCVECKGVKGTMLKPKHKPQKSAPRLFSRWICKTHKCGSYNFNNLRRHETHDCDIETEETHGIIYPKTFGGVNGDVSKIHFKTTADHFAKFKSKWKYELVIIRNTRKTKRR
jgi:hypothetical protein